jgi:hypothetical protein
MERMKSHQLAIGLLALVTTLAAYPAVSPVQHAATPLASPTAGLRAFGTRSAQQVQSLTGRKLDGALADLTRHASSATPGNVLASLHAMSPAARFKLRASDGEPLVMVDAITRGDPQQLKNALTALGMENPSVFSNDVGGWMPISQLTAATQRAELLSIRASMSRTRTGKVTSQGDFAQRSDIVRTNYPALDGTGITVGILSDSYDCYPVYAANSVPASGPAGYASNGFNVTAAQDVASNDLPSGVNVLTEADCLNYGAPTQLPFGDEGRAMMQIVHDVAPGASLAFHTADNSESDFANGITALAAAGAKVIADDVGYFDEPFYQDGLVAQAIDTVEAGGVAYFSAAGNDGMNAYENTAPTFGTLSTTAPTNGEYLLNFDTTGKTTTTSLPVTIPALAQGDFVAIVVEWDQPYVTGASAASPGASSQINLCIEGATGTDPIENINGQSEQACTGVNAIGADPNQILIIGNPANAAKQSLAENINIVIGLANGTPAPTRLKVSVEDDGAGATINSFQTNSATLQGHPGAAGAAAVGAAFFATTPLCGTSPATLETYSSQGGSPILFDTNGTRLATPIIRQKPDFVAPDGGNDTFLGFLLEANQDTSSVSQCQNNVNFPNFFGTSAATPHAAAIATLMLQANAALTPTQIYTALQTTALPMGSTTPDFNNGYGFIQADAALAATPAGPPIMNLSPSSIATGGTSTLTWASVNATSCTASGSWSGAQASTGSLAITAPSTAGTQTYTLSCTSAQGPVTQSVSLTITASAGSGTSAPGGSGTTAPASSGGHGGGSLEEITLFTLGCLTLAQMLRRKQSLKAARRP